jgi:peptide deformylase
MTVYKVLHYAHALLKKKSTPVEKFTDELRDFLKHLIATAYEFEGGGIAAPQVGVNKRIFVGDFSQAFQGGKGFERTEDDFVVCDANGKQIEYKFPMVFVNPEIIETAQPIVTNWEGCLSFPNADSFRINRFHEIKIRAQNEFGEMFTVKTKHLYAAVNFQHEIDHLDGILMIDHWDKREYSEKNVLNDIQDFLDDPKERKRIKKLKLVDAHKIKFNFL